MGVALLVTVGLVGCESTKADRAAVINLVNQSRAAAGRAPLQENYQLDLKADAWARHLRDICRLAHSRLSDGAPSNWTKLGENVGMGGSIVQVHQAYMNSSGHRRNILDPAFTQMGAGAVWGKCGGYTRVFTVQVFMAT